MDDRLDLEHLRSWVGRTEQAEDWITPQLVRGFRATLDLEPGMPADGEPAPLAIHWCLAPPTEPMARLGADGHPARGGFLPPVPLPRRMWAGGELRLVDRLRVGDRVRRCARIEAVDLKHGRTGSLCFVTVRHELTTGRGLALQERHDIVYRDIDRQPATTPAPIQALPAPDVSREVLAAATLLFRYSALTFNGHRIHYDRRYCQEEESYPGLVVHGPLQATLLLHLAADMRGGEPPPSFSFRGVRPLFDDDTFSVNGRRLDGSLQLWTADASGRPTMTASAG